LHSPSLTAVRDAIVSCERCPRLRAYCAEVARTKKRAHRDDVYWGKPVPGFGDPDARLLLVALAPAAHGANRTGRVFTGDGPMGSGDFLMGALHRAGFANIPTAQRVDDGLALTDTFIAAAVRCAPPDNKPAPVEIANCLAHLDAEVSALPRIRVVVALGRIGFEAYLQLLRRRGMDLRPRPEFGHGVAHTLPGDTFGPDAASVHAFHEVVTACAVLIAAGGVAGAIGIVNPSRPVRAEGCRGGQFVGAPEQVADDAAAAA